MPRFFYLISGSAKVIIRHLVDNSVDEVVLEARSGIYFLPFETHVIRYLEDADFILLKSYRYQEDQPDIFPCAVEQ